MLTAASVVVVVQHVAPRLPPAAGSLSQLFGQAPGGAGTTDAAYGAASKPDLVRGHGDSHLPALSRRTASGPLVFLPPTLVGRTKQREDPRWVARRSLHQVSCAVVVHVAIMHFPLFAGRSCSGPSEMHKRCQWRSVIQHHWLVSVHCDHMRTFSFPGCISCQCAP